LRQQGEKSHGKKFRDQSLTIKLGEDSGWDEGTNRDINDTDGSLLVNSEMRSAETSSEVGQGRVIVVCM